jgi:endonuclease/exonuclease/phosphatase family metal-dependent hydrolase
MEFFRNYRDIDIFCLQEIYKNATKDKVGEEWQNDALNLFSDIQNILTNHTGYFRPAVEDCYGLAIFIKNEIRVNEEGDITIYDVGKYRGGGNHSRNLQFVKVLHNNKELLVANVHGLWNGNGKTDAPERLHQSQVIKQFLDGTDGKKILCGDLNLLPDTESLKILEEGMTNLVKEHDVTSTRSSLYIKPDKFADYILVSRDMKVKNFKVLEDEVSDHLPLLIEF